MKASEMDTVLVALDQAATRFEYSRAEQLWGGALPLAERVGGLQLARLLVRKAFVEWVTGNWDEAAASSHEALQALADGTGRPDLVEHSLAYLVGGEVENARAEVHFACISFEAAVSYAVRSAHPVLEAATRCHLGAIFSKMGQTPEAEQNLRKAFKLLRPLTASGQIDGERLPALPPAVGGVPDALSSAYNLEALLHFRRGALDQSAASSRRALECLDGRPPSLQRAEAHRNLGIVASVSYEHHTAIREHSRALDIYERLGHAFGKAKTFNSIGQNLRSMGRLDEALRLMKLGEEICHDLGAVGEASTLYGKLGQVYLQKGNYDQAIHYFHQDLVTTESRENPRAMAHIHRNLAHAMLAKSQDSLGIQHFRTALGLFQKVDDELDAGKVLTELCRAYVQGHNFQRAMSAGQAALKIFQRLAQPQDEVKVRTLLGIVARDSGDFDKALQYFKGSMSRLEGKEASDHMVDALHEFGLLYLKMDLKEEATDLLTRAMKCAQSLGLTSLTMRSFEQLIPLDLVRLVDALAEES